MTTKTRMALLALTMTLAPMPALAQDAGTTTTPADTTTTDTVTTPAAATTTQDRGTDWGWLGLLGLVGLAGLRRQEPTRIVTTDTTRTTVPPR